MSSHTAVAAATPDRRFDLDRYLLRRRIMKVVGAAFDITDEQGQPLFYSELKAFKLKEDIRVYADQSKAEELLVIQARQIIDFSAAYDVTDPVSGEKVGVLKRRGAKSIIRDEWVVLDRNDVEIGVLREDSLGLALVRRFLTNLVPQHYELALAGAPAASFKGNFNPFVYRLDIQLVRGAGLDPRLAVACAILLGAIEGKQG